MGRALAGYLVDLDSGIGGRTRMVAFDSSVTLKSVALGALAFRVTGKKSAVIRWLKEHGALSVILAAELQGGRVGAPSDSGSSNSSSSASAASTERKRQDRCAQSAEKRCCKAMMRSLRGLIRPTPTVCATADANRGGKSLIWQPRQGDLASKQQATWEMSAGRTY